LRLSCRLLWSVPGCHALLCVVVVGLPRGRVPVLAPARRQQGLWREAWLRGSVAGSGPAPQGVGCYTSCAAGKQQGMLKQPHFSPCAQRVSIDCESVMLVLLAPSSRFCLSLALLSLSLALAHAVSLTDSRTLSFVAVGRSSQCYSSSSSSSNKMEAVKLCA
jgi:hypothetical protein